MTYGALPRGVPCIPTALVERNQKVGAAVSVGQREFGIAHLLAGRFCSGSQRSVDKISAKDQFSGRYVRRGSVIASEAMVADSIELREVRLS
jgi:hypothetical protein